MRWSVHIVAAMTWVCATALPQDARATANYKSNPEVQALERQFRITSVSEADIDGDGVDEVAISYRTKGSGTPEGGLMILKPRGGSFRPVFHVFFDSTYASSVDAGKNGVGLTLVRSSSSGDQELYLIWRYGDQLFFNDHPRSPLNGLRTEASSTLRGASAYSDLAIDNNLNTAWAEGGSGTGVGESLTVKLAHPMGVGLIGVFAGKSLDKRAFRRTNRMHRATLEIQTEEDLGDEASALDFSDLGIDIGGDSEELVFENKPQITFFKIKRQRARNLIIKIDSVFLGDKDDDTYIAEFEIVPLIPRSETLGKAKKKPAIKKPAAPSVQGAAIEN